LLELDADGDSFVSAPGAGCVQALTLAGLVTADTSGRPSKREMLRIDAPRPANASDVPARSEPEWDAAPTRIVSYGHYEGGRGSSGGAFIVKKVDGLWRVIEQASFWIS
jgi:hypothetical protein